MQPENYPFYPLSPEDRQIKNAWKSGFVTSESRVTSGFKEKCSAFSFRLDSRCRERVLSLLTEMFRIKERFPLHIEISMQEICLKVQEISKILFVGGGAVEVAEPLLIDFFEQCGLSTLLTNLFKAKLCNKSNDYDFQFLSTNPEGVKEGIVSLLVSKIKWELINLKLLTEQLNNFKRKAERIPYLKEAFASTKEMGRLAVKVFSFVKANDVEGAFFFRNLASQENSYDCFIPVGERPKINSFCIDISNMDDDLYLESLLGREMLLQAIIDANFGILYSDPDHPANDLDFARTICHLSKRGRLTGNGWLKKAFTALDAAAIKRNWRISTFLLPQLATRAESHHRSPQEALIVLVFNASSFLLSLDPALENEVQALWKELANHLINAGKGPQDPLLKEIKFLMCNKSSSFREILTQMQFSSLLCQHEGKGVYKCRPTQSEGMLLTQVLINFSPNSRDDENVDMCTLLFPFAVLDTIPVYNALHDLLTVGSCLTVGIRHSVLKKYRLDPRRKYEESYQKAVELLKVREPKQWKTGYLLALSHLSMSEGKELIYVLKQLISMLMDQWASKEFKSEMAKLMQMMLKNSQINVRDSFFQNPSLHWIIGDLLSSNHDALKRLGWKYFEPIENDRHDDLEALYFDLMKSHLESGRKEDAFLEIVLKRMNKPNLLQIDSALKVYLTLANHIESNVLLEGLISCLRTITDNRIQSKVKDRLPILIKKLLQSSLSPQLILNLAYEAHRLKIFAVEPKEMTVIRELAKDLTGEKFDALSDFMQTYSLQSIETLKASILRRIKDPQDDFFILLKLLAESPEAWNERSFIVGLIENLDRKHDLKVKEVLKLLASTPNKDGVSFYLQQLKKNHACFLYPLLEVLGNENSNEEFAQSLENWIRFQKEFVIPAEIIQKVATQAYNRKLHKELKNLFFAGFLNWTSDVLSVFIRSCHHFEKEKVREILKIVPLDLDLSEDVRMILNSLLLREHQNALQRNDYKEAFEWAEKVPNEKKKLQQQWSSSISDAPIGILERLLGVVSDQDNRLLMTKLESEGSMKFLETDSWWKVTWQNDRELVYHLIRGASCAVTRFFERAMNREQTKGVMRIWDILESEDVSPFLSRQDKLFTCQMRLDFAKLAWFKNKSNALLSLYDTLMLMGDEVEIERKAVALFSLFLLTKPKFASISDNQITLLLIQKILENCSVIYIDCVLYLEFIHNLLTEKAHNPEYEQFFNEAMGSILKFIETTVTTAIDNPSEDSKVKSKEVPLVKWGIMKLYDSGDLMGYDLAVWCLDQPGITKYLDKKEIDKLVWYKDSLWGCGVMIKVLRVSQVIISFKNDYSMLLDRRRYLREALHLQDQFKLQAGEKMILRQFTKGSLILFVQISVIVGLVYGIMRLFDKDS